MLASRLCKCFFCDVFSFVPPYSATALDPILGHKPRMRNKAASKTTIHNHSIVGLGILTGVIPTTGIQDALSSRG